MKIKINFSILLIITLLSLFGTYMVLALPYRTYTIVSPLNNSVQDNLYDWLINVTLNQSILLREGACNYTLGLTNGTILANQSMLNNTLSYWNETGIRPMIESSYGKWHNLSFRCDIHNENYYNDTSGIYLFRVDATNPTSSEMNFTQMNTTTNGYIFVNASVADVNPHMCRIGIQLEDGTFTWYNINTSIIAQVTKCSANFDSSNITQNGDFTIEHWANDTAGRNVNNNETGVASLLKSGWNLVSFTGTLNDSFGGTETLAPDILDNLPGCTHISRWNNLYGWKNYTTYAITTSSVNNDMKLQLGNATWIYCTRDEIYLRKNYLSSLYNTADENISLTVNKTVADSKWNLVALLNELTLNQTLYPTTGSILVGAQTSIDSVSWYNTTLGHYISCVKAFSGTLCTAGYAATAVTVTKASSVWMHVTANVTLNRTGM